MFIPRYNAVVNVQGSVNSPLAVTWAPGKTIEYYIRAAGGGSRLADEGLIVWPDFERNHAVIRRLP